MGTEGGDKCVDNVDKLRKKWCGGEKGRIRKRSPDVADIFRILIFTWGEG
jgi:hypothetical protein